MGLLFHILQYLHFEDNNKKSDENNNKKSDKNKGLEKIRTIFDKLNSNYEKY